MLIAHIRIKRFALGYYKTLKTQTCVSFSSFHPLMSLNFFSEINFFEWQIMRTFSRAFYTRAEPVLNIAKSALQTRKKGNFVRSRTISVAASIRPSRVGKCITVRDAQCIASVAEQRVLVRYFLLSISNIFFTLEIFLERIKRTVVACATLSCGMMAWAWAWASAQNNKSL